MFDPPKPTLRPAEARVTEAHRALPRDTRGPDVVPLGPGARVGDWVITNPLDAGTGHPRYRARHAQAGAIAALVTFAGPPPARFRALAELRHPALVEVLQVGADHVALELVAGDRLSDLLARDGRLAPADALALASGIAELLAAAHAAGHAVRSLDPRDIVVDTRPRPWRCRLDDLDLVPGLVTPSVDGERPGIEALAALTYHMLSGRPPAAPVADVTVAGGALTSALGPGARVGRFRIVERLGEGGMGVVFSAYDPDLDRRVALKILRADVPAEGSASSGRQRLLREARALARLRHPNVIAVHEVGAAGDRVFLAMELADGGTIRQWLEHAPRSWDDVLARFCDAGRGLAAAHDAGFVHRDFKPDNVLLGEGGVRVGDFGLVSAGLAEPSDGGMDDDAAESDRPLTQEGAVMGTPGYMAPEQMRGEAAGPAADQFAFCVSLWEALYRVRPFPRGRAKLLDAIAQGPSPPPAPSEVPADVRAVLTRGLAAEPSARWSSMQALLAELQSFSACVPAPDLS